MIKKRFAALIALVMLLLSACSAQPKQLDTEIGSFSIIRTEYMDAYGGKLGASAGNKLMIVSMKASGTVNEVKLNEYFCPDDENTFTRVSVQSVDYKCLAVAVQGIPGKDDIEYALVFEVPESASGADSILLNVAGTITLDLK
jgi:hypothetical protein